mgnify:CR=1 FL=1
MTLFVFRLDKTREMAYLYVAELESEEPKIQVVSLAFSGKKDLALFYACNKINRVEYGEGGVRIIADGISYEFSRNELCILEDLTSEEHDLALCISQEYVSLVETLLKLVKACQKSYNALREAVREEEKEES